jgi:hypothetical protein
MEGMIYVFEVSGEFHATASLSRYPYHGVGGAKNFKYLNTVVSQPKGSTSLIPKPTAAFDLEPFHPLPFSSSVFQASAFPPYPSYMPSPS